MLYLGGVPALTVGLQTVDAAVAPSESNARAAVVAYVNERWPLPAPQYVSHTQTAGSFLPQLSLFWVLLYLPQNAYGCATPSDGIKNHHSLNGIAPSCAASSLGPQHMPGACVCAISVLLLCLTRDLITQRESLSPVSLRRDRSMIREA